MIHCQSLGFGVIFTEYDTRSLKIYDDIWYIIYDTSYISYPKVYRRAFSENFLSNFTHDSMYGALCTISVQNFNF